LPTLPSRTRVRNLLSRRSRRKPKIIYKKGETKETRTRKFERHVKLV
jgi:hypothetical protein